MTDWRERSAQAARLIPKGDLNQGAFKMSVVNLVRSLDVRDRPMTEIVARSTAVVRTAAAFDFTPAFPSELLDV